MLLQAFPASSSFPGGMLLQAFPASSSSPLGGMLLQAFPASSSSPGGMLLVPRLCKFKPHLESYIQQRTKGMEMEMES
jgi:hypothetical protein